MAVKKTVSKKNIVEKTMVDELIENTPIEESTEEPVEVILNEPTEEPVEVEINTSIDEDKMPKQNVKIKVRENHQCWVGKEHYVFKKGQCYSVPKEVKMRLSRADLLLPL